MKHPHARYQPCSPAQCRTLAAALGDTPETVIAVHLLQRGLGHAYVAGDPVRYAGAIVQATADPREPMGFGADPDILWDLLQSVEGWTCIEVTTGCAPTLGALIEAHLQIPVRYYGDIYYALATPAAPFRHDAVRLLNLNDIALLEAAPVEVRGAGFGTTQALLSEGIAAGAIVDGHIVAIAHTSARTPRHADIGVYTLEPWRGRGFSAAATALVAQRVQEAGQTPVWSTGQDNHASQRVAQRVGFTEVAQRTYIIPAA